MSDMQDHVAHSSFHLALMPHIRVSQIVCSLHYQDRIDDKTYGNLLMDSQNIVTGSTMGP